MRWWQPVDAVALLLRVHPEGAKQVDKHGNLPLHFAVMMCAPPGVVEGLLRVYPDAVAIADRQGTLATNEAVTMLLRQAKRALEKPKQAAHYRDTAKTNASW